MKSIGKFLSVREVPGRGKAAMYEVLSRTGDVLGLVVWYPRWRAYVLCADQDAIWSADCLDDVSKFLRSVNARKVTAEGTT